MPKEFAVLLWMALLGLVAYLIVAFVPLPYPFGVLVIGAAIVLALLMLFRAMGWSLGTPP